MRSDACAPYTGGPAVHLKLASSVCALVVSGMSSASSMELSGLHGYSIDSSFTETFTARHSNGGGGRGRWDADHFTWNIQIYVSPKGRVFRRFSSTMATRVGPQSDIVDDTPRPVISFRGTREAIFRMCL